MYASARCFFLRDKNILAHGKDVYPRKKMRSAVTVIRDDNPIDLLVYRRQTKDKGEKKWTSIKSSQLSTRMSLSDPVRVDDVCFLISHISFAHRVSREAVTEQ